MLLLVLSSCNLLQAGIIKLPHHHNTCHVIKDLQMYNSQCVIYPHRSFWNSCLICPAPFKHILPFPSRSLLYWFSAFPTGASSLNSPAPELVKTLLSTLITQMISFSLEALITEQMLASPYILPST